MSREHLWPAWTRRTFSEEEQAELIPHEMEIQGGVQIDTWNAPVFTATTKTVCEPCNNGWMSALEDRAKPFAEPLILGQQQTINNDGKVAISLWAYLKVLLLQQTAEPVLPKESYETFFDIQGEDLLPLNTSIFIARHVGPRQGQYQHRLLARPGHEDRPTCFIATFTIRELVVQVVKNFTAHEPLMLERDPRVEGNDALIWPAAPDDVDWPVGPGLDDQELTIYTGPQPKPGLRRDAERQVRKQRQAKNRARNKAARQQRKRSKRR
jgi:hypothetical protein